MPLTLLKKPGKIMRYKDLVLRAPEPEDLELLYNWENDTSIWQLSNTLTPFSKFALRKYIENSKQIGYCYKMTYNRK